MKIKPLYIYGTIIIIAIVFLIISSNRGSGSSNSMQGNMPNDDIHKGMPNDDVHKGLNGGTGNPSGSNVSDNVKHMMAKMEDSYKANPNDTLKAREYADFLTSAHQSDKAIPIYQKILDKDTKRTDIRFALAYIYFTKQEFDKSEEIVNKVLDYDKNNLHAKFNKGLILITKGEKEKGKSIWQDLVKSSPNSEIAAKTREALKELD